MGIKSEAGPAQSASTLPPPATAAAATVVPAPAPASAPTVVPPRPTAVAPAPAQSVSLAEENLLLFLQKKSAFAGISLSAESKKALEDLGSILGVKKPSTSEMSRDPRLAAEMGTVKDFEYLVLGNRIMKAADDLMPKVFAPASPEQAQALKRFDQFNKALSDSPALDEFLTKYAMVNSRVGRLI